MDKEDKVDSVVCMYVYIDTYTHAHTYAHTIEYYSAMRKNHTLPFVKT